MSKTLKTKVSSEVLEFHVLNKFRLNLNPARFGDHSFWSLAKLANQLLKNRTEVFYLCCPL